MTSKPRAAWAVYRFGDRVAVSPPEGPTQYLTPAAARAMGRALGAAAQDVTRVRFTDSNYGTRRIDPLAAGRSAKLKDSE